MSRGKIYFARSAFYSWSNRDEEVRGCAQACQFSSNAFGYMLKSMLKNSILMLALLFVATATCARAEGWELVWSDEFDYQGLPDKAKWGYETGFVRNHESQYYTQARLENARVENGMLVIECRKEHFQPPNHAPVEYTSASLTTRNKFTWQYGRIEVRAKLPHGRGVWPAIWTLGADEPRVGWPACGEIDIMEFVGKQPNDIHGTIHYAVDGRHRSDGGKIVADNPPGDFHIYAMEWHTNRIDFFYDGVKYHTASTDKAGDGPDNPFRKPHYLLINFALGGNWGGQFDDAILPQTYLIDYVRVYKPKP